MYEQSLPPYLASHCIQYIVHYVAELKSYLRLKKILERLAVYRRTQMLVASCFSENLLVSYHKITGRIYCSRSVKVYHRQY